jgi:hypothetical protein
VQGVNPVQKHANKAVGLAMVIAGGIQAQIPVFAQIMSPAEQGVLTAFVGIVVTALDWWADQEDY